MVPNAPSWYQVWQNAITFDLISQAVIWEEHGITYVNMFLFLAENLRMEKNSVEINMVVGTMPIPINLSRLNQIKSNPTYFNLTLT